MPEATATIAVIGGSGLYTLFDGESATQPGQAHNARTVTTPYGDVKVTVGELAGKRIAFLPRHGSGHSLAPHRINYRANIWALASLGVRAIISSAAVGGLSATHPVDSLVLTDQYIDRTHGRDDTFFDEDSVQHLPSADPFCPILHALAIEACGATVLHRGTVAVVQGPRFSTRAESDWLKAAGADLVNMTLYPEVPLASELNIGTVNLAYVTDTDAKPEGEPVSAGAVFARLRDARPRIISAISAIASAIPEGYHAAPLIDQEAVRAVLNRERK